MLASDDNNPEFVNPKDPDSMLSVEFYDFAALDKWETEKQGIKVYKKSYPYVRIAIPGNDKSIIETPAAAEHTRRFPRQWLYYQMQTGKITEGKNVPGWQLADWDELNPDQLRDLQFKRFTTVEQLAGTSDAQVQYIGMDGPRLRIKAQEALRARNSKAVSEAVAERDAKIADMESQMAQMRDLMKQVLEAQRPAADAAVVEAVIKRKPGRKPKAVAAC